MWLGVMPSRQLSYSLAELSTSSLHACLTTESSNDDAEEEARKCESECHAAPGDPVLSHRLFSSCSGFAWHLGFAGGDHHLDCGCQSIETLS